MAKSVPRLLIEARWALDIPSQGAMGTFLGSSRRSGQRWERGEAHPTGPQVQQLARLVYPKNASLAAEIAAAAGTTVEALGLVPRPPPPPPPVPVAPVVAPAPTVASASVQVDSLVLSAAEALDASPRVVRPVLYAAFARARQLALTVEVVEETLRPKPEAKPKPAPKRP
jgi:hypothetical protein